MGRPDKLFGGLLCMPIARMKKAVEEKDPEKPKELLMEIINYFQNTLED